MDARAPAAVPLAWEVQADLEALCWAPHAPTQFVASDEGGMVTCFDARAGARVLLHIALPRLEGCASDWSVLRRWWECPCFQAERP